MVKALGIYLIIDAVASLIKFRHQHWFYQLVRIVRGAIGFYFIITG